LTNSFFVKSINDKGTSLTVLAVNRTAISVSSAIDFAMMLRISLSHSYAVFANVSARRYPAHVRLLSDVAPSFIPRVSISNEMVFLSAMALLVDRGDVPPTGSDTCPKLLVLL